MEQSAAKEFIKWSDSEFGLGIATIDDHHQVLVALINEIYQAFMERKHADSIVEIIQKLEEYAVFHFSFEERLFDQVGYSQKSEHVIQHQAFVKRVDAFRDQVDAGIDATFGIVNFLRDWLKAHIQEEDRKYVNELRAAGIA